MRRAAMLLPILLLCLRLSAQQSDQLPEPNCTPPGPDEEMTQWDMNQCAAIHFHKADGKLNSLYRKLIASIRAELADDMKQKNADGQKYERAALAKLRASEIAWIKYRDLHCDAARHQVEGGSMSPQVWGECMAETTEDRVKELKFAYDTVLEP